MGIGEGGTLGFRDREEFSARGAQANGGKDS